MRKLAVGLVLGIAMSLGATSAQAAPIVVGTFTWDLPVMDGEGPLFTFVNSLNVPVSDIFLDLATDDGLKSFAFLGDVCSDPDGDGANDVCESTPFIPPSHGSSQIPAPLNEFTIFEAFIRSSTLALFLVDTEGNPLIENGSFLGLNGLDRTFAQVAYEAPDPPPNPVPEPSTMLLVGMGILGALSRSRRRLRRP